MPRVCRVCVDSNREAIEAELVAGRSVPQISREFHLPSSNLYRHRKDHLNLTKVQVESAPPTNTIQFLQARDADLAQVQAMAVTRGHTQAAVAALNQRIRISLEIADMSGEILPKPKTVMHINVDKETAERIAMSYMRHQQLSGDTIDAKTKPQ